MIKEDGDNSKKCRKTAEGRAGLQTATLHSPTPYSTSPRKHLYSYVHVRLENSDLKSAMKWDGGGIDFFFFSMPALRGQKTHEYGDLTFALFSLQRRAATLTLRQPLMM